MNWMFRKIRERITLFNTLTLICFLLLFIFSLIGLIKSALSLSGKSYLRQAAAAVSENEAVGAEPDNSFHGKIGYDYIIWNPTEGIAAQTTNDAPLVEAAHSRLDESVGEDGKFDTVNLPNGTYRIFSENFIQNGQELRIQVIQDISAENEIISYLMECLVIIGAIGLLCLVPISYFLAGRSLRPIKESYDSQKKFIADASHELRSPLTVMRTNLDLLEMKQSQTIGENMKWLRTISMECDNMANLVSEMFLIAQADSGQLRFESAPVSLSDMAEDVMDLMEGPADEKDIELDAVIEPGVEYVGDRDKLMQLMRIFMDNAIKYTPADGEVTLELTKDSGNVRIQVTDTGIGIPKEDQAKIFERFYRCDEARERGAGGSGLGLNIAQSIVSHYGGSIGTRSVLGSGTTFTVLLPITPNGPSKGDDAA